MRNERYQAVMVSLVIAAAAVIFAESCATPVRAPSEENWCGANEKQQLILSKRSLSACMMLMDAKDIDKDGNWWQIREQLRQEFDTIMALEPQGRD